MFLKVKRPAYIPSSSAFTEGLGNKNQLYIALLFVIIVCSLGNRPQGSKWTYSIAMILFGFCNIITLYCAGFTIYLAVPHTVAGWKNFPECVISLPLSKHRAYVLFLTLTVLLCVCRLVEQNKALQQLVISIAATYGLYFISSFMHLEPWHMFTSFVQYMFLLPSCEFYPCSTLTRSF